MGLILIEFLSIKIELPYCDRSGHITTCFQTIRCLFIYQSTVPQWSLLQISMVHYIFRYMLRFTVHSVRW